MTILTRDSIVDIEAETARFIRASSLAWSDVNALHEAEVVGRTWRKVDKIREN